MAIVMNLKGKVLVQIGDREPVEVGTIDIPVKVHAEAQAKANPFAFLANDTSGA